MIGKVLIDDKEIDTAISTGLEAISAADFKTHTCSCPNCGLPVRFPLIARRQDVEDFRRLMKTAYSVMDKYGITANLIAEIISRCHIAIAQKASKADGKGGAS